MPQSDIERTKYDRSSGGGGMSWLWIAVVLVLVLLLVMWFWPDGTGMDPIVTAPASGEMRAEPTLNNETRTGESSQPGADRADESTTSSNRAVAIPASPGIATQDVGNADASGAPADR